MYSVAIDFGLGPVDCTDYLIGQYPIRRSRSIHNGLKPVIGTCKFGLHRNTTLINYFLTATTDPEVTVLHDGAAYFKGTIRRTVRVQVGQIRVEGIECQCVDPLYRMESKVLRTSFTWSNYKVSDPATKTASILHQLFYLAGYDDTELDLDEIDVTVDRYTVDGTEKPVSIRSLIEEALRDTVYTLKVLPNGTITLYDLYPASYTATMTLSTGSGGNIAEGYGVERDEYKSEAVDVTYWAHQLIEDAVVFEDTTGGTEALPCSIPITAGNYYPEGADASTEIRCVFDYPDYDLVAVDSPVIDWSHTGDVSLDVETVDGLGMLVRFSSATGGVLTKFRITGDATVKWIENKVVDEIVASSDEREVIKSELLSQESDARRLAAGRSAWHKNSTFSYTFSRLTLDALGSNTLYPADDLHPADDLYPAGDILIPGDIVQIIDTNLLGANQTARVVRVDDGSDPKTFMAVCEGVDAYTPSYVAGTPTRKGPRVPVATVVQANADAQAIADAAQAATIKTTRGTADFLGQIGIFDGLTYRCTALGSVLMPATTLYPAATLYPSGTTWTRISIRRYDDVVDSLALAELTGMVAGDTVFMLSTGQWYHYTTSWEIDKVYVTQTDIVSHTPHYLGAYEAAHPASYSFNDSWLVYDTDDSPIMRGFYYSNNGVPERITTSSSAELKGKMVAALADIAWAEDNGYGTAANYGGFDAFFSSMAAVTAFIKNLFTSSVRITVSAGENAFIIKAAGHWTFAGIPATNSTSYELARDTTYSMNDPVWIKVAASGTIRIKFSLRTSNSSYYAYGKIYKRAMDETSFSAVGTEQSTNSSSTLSSLEFSEDFTVNNGDTFALFIKSENAAAYAYACNVKACISEDAGIMVGLGNP